MITGAIFPLHAQEFGNGCGWFSSPTKKVFFAVPFARIGGGGKAPSIDVIFTSHCADFVKNEKVQNMSSFKDENLIEKM